MSDHDSQEPEGRPHPLALLLMVLFPFLLMAVAFVLYRWLAS
jgi:hypothetical protein